VTTTDDTRVPPPKLEALVSEDGETVIVSFALDPEAPEATLTAAESEIIALLFGGHSNREIAALRGTKTRTIANQVASLFRKLDVGSRLELVTRAAILRASLKSAPNEGT